MLAFVLESLADDHHAERSQAEAGRLYSEALDHYTSTGEDRGANRVKDTMRRFGYLAQPAHASRGA